MVGFTERSSEFYSRYLSGQVTPVDNSEGANQISSGNTTCRIDQYDAFVMGTLGLAMEMECEGLVTRQPLHNIKVKA